MSEKAQGASLPSLRRESSDFSIERILSKDVSPASSSAYSSVEESLIVPEQNYGSFLHDGIALHSSATSFVVRNKLDWLRNLCKLQPPKSEINVDEQKTNSAEPVKETRNSEPEKFNSEELSWLRCTRYRPPKLPRKSCAGKNFKRKPGSHPRIPFTKYQLEVLEEKYKCNAYLSRKDVVNLSDLLHLPQSRIKIWFQNRRARERRESQTHEQIQTTRI